MQTVLRDKCSQCGKVAKEKRRASFAGKTYIFLECGHKGETFKVEERSEDQYESLSCLKHGHKLRHYQIESIKFAEKANYNCLFAHEPGVGKTIIAAGALTLHPELLPAAILCKATLKYQWQIELMDWSKGKLLPQIVQNSNSRPYDMFNVHILSIPMLRRLKWLGDWAPKTVIIDECQAVKNPDAEQTKLVRALCNRATYTMALSGTPIKNHALEYFTILNILQPELFYSETAFMREDLEYYHNGYTYKVGGVRDADNFKEKTKHFILRYTRKEVLPELPSITRQFRYNDLGEDVRKRYKEVVDDFQNFYDEKGTSGIERYQRGIAYLSKMRHITGLAKIEPTLDFVTEFMTDAPERKLTLFVHHQDVGQLLYDSIKDLCSAGGFEEPLQLISEKSPEERNAIVNEFTDNPKRKILIASTLASGEGLNLQVCSDCVLVERQWNPANEEQAEARFPRLRPDGTVAEAIFATYMIAKGTIDEFLAEMVERKRQAVSKTLDGTDYKWDESSIMKELMETISQRGYKWS